MLSAHCPDGLTSAVWRGALTEFARLKAADEPMGQLLRPVRDRNAAADASRRLAQMGAGAGAGAGARVGVVAQWLAQKRFGFVQEKGRGGKKVFFHLSVAAQGWAPQQVACRAATQWAACKVSPHASRSGVPALAQRGLQHRGLQACCRPPASPRVQPATACAQPATPYVSQGDAVTFELGADARGRPECTAVGPAGVPSGGGKQAYGRQADAGTGYRVVSVRWPLFLPFDSLYY